MPLYDFVRPFRNIERLFPGSRAGSSSPEPRVVSDLIQPIWDAFDVRQTECVLRSEQLGPTASVDGTMQFTPTTAAEGRVHIYCAVAALQGNGGARFVGVQHSFNAVSAQQLDRDFWITWRRTGVITPLQLGLTATVSGTTVLVPIPIPVWPSGSSLSINFFAMTAAGGGTAQVDCYYIDAPTELVRLGVQSRT